MTTDSARLLDPVGWRILDELQADARLSYSELGARVGLSPAAVAERMRRMEEAGIITGYRAEINPARLELPISAYIRCTSPGPQVGQIARDAPEVIECHRITGGDAFILKVAVRSVGHLEALIDRLLPYGQPTTMLILSSPVPRRGFARDAARYPDDHAG